MKMSISDVARAAKVSKSTVSQYLNNRFNYMSVETKERIKQAIEELNYRPNYVARSLKQKKTSTIGVIVANLLHNVSTMVIRAIEDYCQPNQIHVIVCNSDDDPKKEKNYIEMLRAKQVDGLIVFPAGGNMELYQQMLKEEYPLVFVDRLIPQLDVCSILLDNEKASALAVEHFIESGITDIAILTASLAGSLTPRVERISGYRKALATSGIRVKEEYIKGTDLHFIQDACKEMLRLPNPPKGIVAGNDLVLMEILRLIKEDGIQIPTDIALIGIDDVSFAGIFNPALTTIAQPAFEMGKKAASLLLEQINEERDNCRHVFRFEPKLLIRKSCKLPS